MTLKISRITLPLLALSNKASTRRSTVACGPLRVLGHSYSTMPTGFIPPATPIQPSSTKAFPYKPSDFTPSDIQSASAFYMSPRFVNHIDDAAIAGLRKYYEHCLPSHPGARILDLCSSWVSHFPAPLERAAQAGSLWVAGIGMNAAELARNPLLRAWEVRDLDARPDVARSGILRGATSAPEPVDADDPLREDQKLDASTLVVSIDYLRRPVAVLASLRRATRRGGSVHVVLSNRCFPTKAVHGWLQRDEGARVQMVGDLLWWSGWRDVESVVVRDGFGGGVGGKDGQTFGSEEEEASRRADAGEDKLRNLMQSLGFYAPDGTDPLWVVRARNTGEGEGAVPEGV